MLTKNSQRIKQKNTISKTYHAFSQLHKVPFLIEHCDSHM